MDLRATPVGAAAVASSAAASWGAIFAGAVVAVGVSIILLSLGSGLGFAAISPWHGQGVSATAFSIYGVIWLIVTQWVSALFGGYIAGRLRTRWIGTHVHEVFFRDTAHGLVTWALATLLVVGLVISSAVSGISGGVKAATSVASAGVQSAAPAMANAASGGSQNSGLAYGVDKLFRPNTPTGSGSAPAGMGPSGMGPGAGSGPDARMEATRILVNGLATGSVPDADRTYLVSVVAARTGLSESEAQQRVDDFITAAKQAEDKVKAEADEARKDAAQVAIYTALSLLIGAFIASVSAVLGGRLRDEHV